MCVGALFIGWDEYGWLYAVRGKVWLTHSRISGKRVILRHHRGQLQCKFTTNIHKNTTVGYTSQTVDGMVYKLILNFNAYEEPLNIISLVYAAFSQKALILADTP